jgi:hypothetical protein
MDKEKFLGDNWNYKYQRKRRFNCDRKKGKLQYNILLEFDGIT